MSKEVNQLVLITGTSQGIGEAVAKLFLDKGYDVVGFDRNPTTITHSRYSHWQMNITRSCSLPDLLRPVNIIINNAGTQCEEDMDNNFWATFNITETYLSRQTKSVLMISSASAITGAEFAEYCASKGAMTAYSKHIAQRCGKWGATCNSLCPGGVYTKMNEHIVSNADMLKQVLSETLLNKWATSEDIAQWAYFLTVTNNFATGQDFLVDGGEALKSNFIW